MFVPLLMSLCLLAPGPVVEPFVNPACPYCAGRRAIEVSVVPDSNVAAPVDGIVSFAGSVAGRRFVSIASGPLTVTVGGLASIEVDARTVVRAGDVLGRAVSGRITLSLRSGAGTPAESYLDPGPFLGVRVGRARLVPTDGTRPRAAGSTRLVCPAGR